MPSQLPIVDPVLEVRDIGYTYLLHVDEKFAYVGRRRLPILLDGTTQLTIFDITNPGNPRHLGSLTVPRLRCFSIQGRYAYAGSRGGLHVIDLADPRQPALAGYFPLSRPHAARYVDRIELRQDLAFIAAEGAGMLVLDIETPSVPKLLSTYFPPSRTEVTDGRTREFTGYVANLALGTSHIYVDNLFGQLYAVDISDPAQPQEVGFLSLGTIHVLKLHGQHAYVATRGREASPGPFYILDVSTPAEPLPVHAHDTLDIMSDLCFVGSTAFSVGGTPREAGLQAAPDALHSWDLADAHHPIHLGTYALSAWKVAVNDGLLYLADEDGLRIFALHDGF